MAEVLFQYAAGENDDRLLSVEGRYLLRVHSGNMVNLSASRHTHEHGDDKLFQKESSLASSPVLTVQPRV